MSKPLGLRLKDKAKRYVPKQEEFATLVSETVVGEDGLVTKKSSIVYTNHPCNGVDSNHYRLDVIIEASPESLTESNFKVSNDLKAMDSLYNLQSKVNAFVQ